VDLIQRFYDPDQESDFDGKDKDASGLRQTLAKSIGQSQSNGKNLTNSDCLRYI